MRYLITGARPPSTQIQIQHEFESRPDGAKKEIADYLKTNRIAFLRIWTLDIATTNDAWEEKNAADLAPETAGDTKEVKMDDIVAAIADEWGSVLCYKECSHSNPPLQKCRCYDIANALAAKYDIRAKAKAEKAAKDDGSVDWADFHAMR